ncbi:DUF6233 domain-containing protein [Streptomyces luteogriseus]|uniref:DUF6233 domain-containing protein n=1 Tax=Streptomyces luteogriseus TaxID=68233 RepID=UPI00261C54CF|nr:DUF6233 domain-containing protein [uncultured Streptomyces sp.]
MGTRRPRPYVGDCWNAGGRSRGVGRHQTSHALAAWVTACPQCRPDTAWRELPPTSLD